MSKEGVMQVVGRMISDENFRKAVHADAEKAIAESGYHVTGAELSGIKKLKPEDLQVTARAKRVANVDSFDCNVKKATV